jgi:uncharacterized protein with NRDE domain
MCTVTYLPKAGDSFIFTSNRDEKLSRPSAELPKVYTIHGKKLIFPKDPQSGGTWIASSFQGQTAAILNGAFEKHISDPPYRKSRGIVLLDLFKYKNIQAFVSQYGFTNIEPFTLVFTDGHMLCNLRWNGKDTFLKELNPKNPHIWSSASLFPEEDVARRNNLFTQWLTKHKDPRVEDIRQFHHFYEEKALPEDVATLSITSIVKENSSIKMTYEDLINESLYIQSF